MDGCLPAPRSHPTAGALAFRTPPPRRSPNSRSRRSNLIRCRSDRLTGMSDRLKIEIEQESDGRWIAEVPDLPGGLVYGATRDNAIQRAEALALRALADRLEHGEAVPAIAHLFANA